MELWKYEIYIEAGEICRKLLKAYKCKNPYNHKTYCNNYRHNYYTS